MKTTSNTRLSLIKRRLVGTTGEEFEVPIVELGLTVELHRVSDYARIWNLKRTTDGTPNIALAKKNLIAMGVPIVEMPDGNAYYNAAALEAAMFFLTRFGGPGFFAPGSYAKAHYSKAQRPHEGLTKVTPESITQYGKGLEDHMIAMAETRRVRSLVRIKKAARQTADALGNAAKGAPPA